MMACSKTFSFWQAAPGRGRRRPWASEKVTPGLTPQDLHMLARGTVRQRRAASRKSAAGRKSTLGVRTQGH